MRVGTASAFLAVMTLFAGPAAAQCRIEGTVRSQDGTPLAAATVRVEIFYERVPLTATVAADGSYRVDNVKAGRRVEVVVLQGGRVVAKEYLLVTSRVEKLDLTARPSSSRVTGDQDLDPEGGPSGSLVGVVRNSDGAAVPAAFITIAGTSVVATTDSAGRYAFNNLRAGISAGLEASASGYKSSRTQATVTANAPTDTGFTLQPDSGADVPGANLAALHISSDNGTVRVRPDQAAGVPSLGRHDVFRALQFLPGVQGASEASADFSVRGGSPGENLITLDGFTLYPVLHPFGLFSALNTDAIEAVNFSESPVDAADGGRLSAVERVAGRSGAHNRATGSVDFSLLGTRAVVAVPLGGLGSVLFAARRSFPTTQNDKVIDLLADDGTQSARDRVGRYSGGTFSLTPTSSFRDLNGKVELNLTRRDHLAVSVYDAAEDQNNSRDITLTRDTSVAIPPVDDLPADTVAAISDLQMWTARGASAAWTHRWSPGASTSVSFGRSKTWTSGARSSLLTSPTLGGDYSFVAGRGGSNGLTDTNDIEDTTLRVDNSVAVGFGHAWSFGGEITTLDVSYDMQREVMNTGSGADSQRSALVPLLSHHGSGSTLTAYVQDSWRPLGRLTVSPGARLTHYNLASATYFEPRISADYQLGPVLHLKAGWAVDHQQANRIIYEDRVQGDRAFWALADGTSIPVSRADTLTVGFGVEIPGVVLDIRGYAKQLDALSILAPRLDPGMPPDATADQLQHGTGTVRGVDILAQKEWSRTTLWMAYTASKADYSFPTLEADSFPASWDRPHELKVAASQRLPARWWLSGTWVVASGAPYTPATGIGAVWYPTGVALSEITFGAKNSGRLPAYHRLDLSTERECRLHGFKSTLGVAVFNVYGQTNVAMREYELAGSTLTTTDLRQMGRVINAFVRVGF